MFCGSHRTFVRLSNAKGLLQLTATTAASKSNCFIHAPFTPTGSLRSSVAHMSQPTKQRGAFILFEGIDRSGKTTQCTKLVEYLKNHNGNAEMWRFPDRTTKLGEMIDAYLSSSVELNDAAVHLVFAANRWEKSKAMLKALEAGTTLVVDRYSFSGMAYTLAKRLPGIDTQWCRAPEVGLPAPDLVFYMRSSPSANAQRGGFGEERYEKAEFQKLVSANFDNLKEDNWVEVDAAQPIDDIHKQITHVVEQLFSGDKLQGPVRKMYTAVTEGAIDAEATVELQVNGLKAAPAAVQPVVQSSDAQA